MGIIQIFIWAIVVISAFIFIRFFLYPYLLRKFVLFTLENKVKQMAKKYSGKTAEKYSNNWEEIHPELDPDLIANGIEQISEEYLLEIIKDLNNV